MGPMIAKWLKLSLVALVGCGFVAMVIYAFVQRDQIRSAQIEPPLVAAPEEVVKRRPEAPGGMEIPNRDKLVFDLLENDTTGQNITSTQVPLAPLVVVSESAVVAAVSAAVVLAEVEPAAIQPLPEVRAAISETKVEVTKVEKIVVEPKKVSEENLVKVEVKGGWGVQLGAVSGKSNADIAVRKLGKQTVLKNLKPLVVAAPDGKHYRIQFVGVANRSAAQKICAALGAKQPCFPVMVK